MLKKLLKFINPRGQIEDIDSINEMILQGAKFKGANFWILICAIIIASIGLNINSTAVIIGAMLISPLMGPINGIGYSIAVYDFTLFKISARNFGFAVVGSLLASSLYFATTPISTAYSELLARTSPTIYDVLIAMFGGFAGMIAISCKQKGNVIPGVAIATALMPPLCTAGYGLATFQWNFFFGAFYLFTINSICIAYATLITSQFFKFPILNPTLNDKRKKTINRSINILLLVTVLPSIYLGYKLTGEENFKIRSKKYIESISILNKNYLLNQKVSPSDKKITLIYGGTALSDSEKDSLKMLAKNYALEDASIEIQQGLSIDFSEIKDQYQTQEVGLQKKIAQLNGKLQEYADKEEKLRLENELGEKILTELNPLFPTVRSCNYSKGTGYTISNDSISKNQTKAIIMIYYTKTISSIDRKKIESWLSKRLQTDEFEVYFEKYHK